VDPLSLDALVVRGGIHEAAGRHDQAIADYRTAAARSHRFTIALSFLGYALGRAGNREEAEQILNRLDELRRTQYVSAMDSMLVTLALGQVDESLQWLERAIAERSGWVVYLKTDRRLDPLRDNPRFQSILERIELGKP
jgi:tetratricopeptide (TPR) repeat protein